MRWRLSPLLGAAIEHAERLPHFLGLSDPAVEEVRGPRDLGKDIQRGGQRGVPIAGARVHAPARPGRRLRGSGRLVDVGSSFFG
jgi:hypothetical protein